MPIYLAIPLKPDTSALDQAVLSIVPEHDRFKLQAEAGWLFKFDGTTVEASNFLTITGQPQGAPAPIGSALVVPVSSYYGRGPAEMWEWLVTRLEQ